MFYPHMVTLNPPGAGPWPLPFFCWSEIGFRAAVEGPRRYCLLWWPILGDVLEKETCYKEIGVEVKIVNRFMCGNVEIIGTSENMI